VSGSSSRLNLPSNSVQSGMLHNLYGHGQANNYQGTVNLPGYIGQNYDTRYDARSVIIQVEYQESGNQVEVFTYCGLNFYRVDKWICDY